MADYTQRRALVENEAFRRRLQMALWIAADAILLDGAASQEMRTWARIALRTVSPPEELMRLAIRASANATIGEAGEKALDSDIQYVVSQAVKEIAA